VCGSLDECPHDREDDDDLNFQSTSTGAFGKAIAKSISATSRPHTQHAGDSYEMVSNTPILPYSEVFNNYGAKLTNAQLLVRYGFALDENENDCITWNWSDLYTVAATVHGATSGPHTISGSSDCGIDNIIQMYCKAVKLWPSASLGWTETGLVHNAETGTASRGGRGRKCKGYTERAPYGAGLSLNGDGIISHHLWLYCALLGHQTIFHDTDSGVEEVVEQLRKVADLLMQLVGSADDRHNNMEHGRLFDSPRTAIAEVVGETIRTVLCLCHSRSNRIGKDQSNAMDMGEELDGIPPQMTRTRKAMVEALSEKSLLECAQSVWSGLLGELRKIK